MERALYITNFRNIGFKKSERIVLNHSLEKGEMGNLVVVVGANNSGKSNVLDAICAFGAQKIDKKDITTLAHDLQYKKPQLSLSCKDNTNEYTYRLTYGQENSPDISYPQSKKIEITNLQELREILSYLISKYPDPGNHIGGRYTGVIRKASSHILDSLPYSNNAELQKNVKDLIQDLHFFESHGYGEAVLKVLRNQFSNSEFVQLENKLKDNDRDKLNDNYNAAYGTQFLPQIVRYTDTPIKTDQLSCEQHNLTNNNFLLTVLAKSGISKETVQSAYDTYTQYQDVGILRDLEKDINKKLASIVSDFNRLYFADNEHYGFEFRFESNKIQFLLLRGDKNITLDLQSTGFKWFFNLYFNLLCKNDLQAGDIIVMDQPGMDLHIRGREELRRFLKEFARRNDLTIVIATHEPSMIDLDHLDEIRVVSMKDNQSHICNDFAAIDPDDPDCLKPIKDALTIENRILFDPDANVIFVEGITDYNYLLAFKKRLGVAYQHMHFLPINGVGNINEDGSEEKQKYISRALIQMKKHNPVLLVDSDVAGNAMKKVNEKDSGLRVCTLSEIDPSFKTIESVFDPDDLKKMGLVSENGQYIKHASTSAVIKNHVESRSFSETTLENFKKVFEYLLDN